MKKGNNGEADEKRSGSKGENIHYWAPDRVTKVFFPQYENSANVV